MKVAEDFTVHEQKPLEKMVKRNANNPQTAAFTVVVFNPLCILNTQGMFALYSVTGNVGITQLRYLYVKKISLTIDCGQNSTL